MKKIRVDKWLWSIRLYKSRSLSTQKCKKGKIIINEEVAKPSSTVSEDDLVMAEKQGVKRHLIVKRLIEKRVGAPEAEKCYEDVTPKEELHKFESWFVGKAKGEYRGKGLGRPTKKDRRAIEKFKRSRKR